MSRETYTFKLLPELLDALRERAERENRSLNNLVETILLAAVEPPKPKKGKR